MTAWSDLALICRRSAGELEHAQRRLVVHRGDVLPDHIADALKVAHEAAATLEGTARRLANLADRRDREERDDRDRPDRRSNFAPPEETRR